MNDAAPSTTLPQSRIELALAGRSVFVLVDPAACAIGVGNPLGLQRTKQLQLSGLVAEAAREREVLPYLACLSQDPTRAAWQQRQLEEWALETHGVSWVESDVAIEQLAQCLSSRLDAIVSDEQPVVLRVCDTRVLPVLETIFDADERAAFMHPVQVWWYFDREEQLQALRSRTVQGRGDPWATPWPVKPAQEAALLAAAEPDTVIAILREHAPAELNAIPRNQRHSLIASQIEQASVWGLVSSQQLALYCLVALRRGPLFAWQPAWQTQLGRVKSGAISIEDAIELADLEVN